MNVRYPSKHSQNTLIVQSILRKYTFIVTVKLCIWSVPYYAFINTHDSMQNSDQTWMLYKVGQTCMTYSTWMTQTTWHSFNPN